MKYNIFLDTNVLLSGIFFEGNESIILDLIELELITCEDVVDELKSVIRRKLKYLSARNLEIAISEIERALSDIKIIPRTKYVHKIKEATELITHKKDAPILAAVISAKPNYFLTGDSHFFTEKIKNVVNVKTAKEFFDEMKYNK